MGPDSGACHVEEIKRTYKGKVYSYFLLRRSYREAGKVKHQTLGNLSLLPPPTLELVRRAVRGDALVSPKDAFEIIRTRPHGHVAAVLGTLRKSGIETIIAPKRSAERDRCVALIVSRIIEPCSKLATARALSKETLISTLGEILDVEDGSEDELYLAMDWLLARQGRIEEALAKKQLSNGTLVLYDVTSTYFEGRHCPLAQLGHPRDGKKGKLQIVFGLLCNAEGCPVAVEVFAGNVGDPKTVASQIVKVRDRFHLARLVLVGDRGMITAARIREDLKSTPGVEWITALRAPAIKKLLSAGAIQLGIFDEMDLAEITSPDYPGERLVVCRNPLLAEERKRKREELLKATEKELSKIAEATRRKKRPLHGKANIALRVGRMIGQYKMRKHFRLSIRDNSFAYKRRQKKIDEEAALDGIYVIRTSVSATNHSTEDSVRWYKRLSVIERAFRYLKTVDINTRPIFHRREDRVRAHVFICMLAYYVEWHMREALCPILFQDDDPEAGQALRRSIVAPAQRSPQAIKKIRTKRTEDGGPVHSFHTLLTDLSTIAKNRVRPKGAAAAVEFDVVTTPTAPQQRAFNLLGVSHLM